LTLANGSSLITSGGHSLTLTTSNTTSLTLPTTGTLATTSNKLSDFAATTSLELKNTISDETGSGALVFATSPDFTTSVTTGSGTFALFNATATTINAFGAATVMSIGAATGKATFNSTDNSISATTGGLVVSGGAGIAKSVSIGGRLQMFNSSLYTAFLGAQSGVNTTYTLPATSPATGSSVLQCTAAGIMSWAPLSSGGLQTVATGNFGYVQYVGIDNAFASNGLFVYDEGDYALKLGYYSPTPSYATALLQLKQSNSFWNGSDNGTYLAISAGTAFTGELIHAQLDGVSRLQLNA
jgi:hypothetical protein